MKIEKLTLVNFKNYVEATFNFHDKVNCFFGNNGEGKTNVLDAIYYLSFCKSYFNPIDSQNIRYDQDFFLVQGEYKLDGQTDKLHCGIKKGQKKAFKRNKKEYDRLADHIGNYPLVIISPNDSMLIYEGSDERRKFIDSIISQYKRSYLDDVIKYNKTVSHRNALLKLFFKERKFDQTTLDAWNHQLIEYGNRIFEARKEFLAEFEPIFQKFYKEISGRREEVQLVYQSQLHDDDFLKLLIEATEVDTRRQHSTVGVHKDDLVFSIANHPLKKFGSQGQQKSYLIALKLAQLEFLKKLKGVAPILLLDDIFDKLDEQRVKYLLELVNTDVFGQIFITDTHVERIQKLLSSINGSYKRFEISNGEIISEVNEAE